MIPSQRSALIVVDVQNDFCPGGSLAVPDGDKVVAPINALIQKFKEYHRPVLFSRDWHPLGAKHFEKWPSHCIQNTKGADFHPGLEYTDTSPLITKGDDKNGDAYSAFDGKVGGKDLDLLLEEGEIQDLIVAGLATDYCVKATVIDALARGYHVTVVLSACRAVNLKPEDGVMAIVEMMENGAKIVW